MRIGIVMVVFSGPFTALFVVSMVKRLIPMLRASRGGAVAQGRVLQIKTRNGGAPGFPTSRREAHIQFTPAGGERTTCIEILEQGVECRTGKAVTVHYLPADPSASATIKDPYDVSTRLWIMGGLTVMFGFFLVFGVLAILGVVNLSGATATSYAG
jgi:hypothetical protein